MMTPDIGQKAKGRTISSLLVQTPSRFGMKDEARAEKTGNCRGGSLGRRVAIDAGLVTILLVSSWCGSSEGAEMNDIRRHIVAVRGLWRLT
jgi:hypothetical protein